MTARADRPEERLGELMRTAGAKAAAHVRSKVPPSDVQDVLQDVWLRTYLWLSRRPPQAADDLPLLWTAVRRAVADHWRRAREPGCAEQPPEDAAMERDLTEGLLSASLTASVEEILATLPLRQREVLHLRLLEGLPLAAIAQRLGLPEGTVKSRLHNGRRTLQERLDAWRRPALCADLASSPLGLGWGLRSLASTSVVAAHLATCAHCAREWQQLEQLTHAVSGTAGAQDATLRVGLRVERDLSVWLEGDLMPANGRAVTVAAAGSFGPLHRLADERGRNLGPDMRFLPGGGGDVPDRYAVKLPTAGAGGGRMRFVHRLDTARAAAIDLLRPSGSGWVLAYENVPTFNPQARVRSSVFVALPAGARLRGASPQPAAAAVSFGRPWLGFFALARGGESQNIEVRFTLQG